MASPSLCTPSFMAFLGLLPLFVLSFLLILQLEAVCSLRPCLASSAFNLPSHLLYPRLPAWPQFLTLATACPSGSTRPAVQTPIYLEHRLESVVLPLSSVHLASTPSSCCLFIATWTWDQGPQGHLLAPEFPCWLSHLPLSYG